MMNYYSECVNKCVYLTCQCKIYFKIYMAFSISGFRVSFEYEYLTSVKIPIPWWRHQMETLYALLALCAGNSPVTCEFPSQSSVTRSFDVFFDLGLNKWLRKQSRRRWFEMSLCSLWRHCNANYISRSISIPYKIVFVLKQIHVVVRLVCIEASQNVICY